MNIAIFGSSLLSAYRNHAATYYRGILRALHARGHQITFYEMDEAQRLQHRDIQLPSWAQVVLYPATEEAVLEQVEHARHADLLIKSSGLAPFETLLDEAILDCRHPGNLTAFWDVDIPTTLDRLHADPGCPSFRLLPRYDIVFTRGGGDEIADAYRALGVHDCLSLCNALDPSYHHPSPTVDEEFECDLALMASHRPDRSKKFESLFIEAATLAPTRRFLLAGTDWDAEALPSNIHCVGHLSTCHHNALHSSATAILSLQSPALARYGHTPSARLFEAAGAAACLISDEWPGIEDYFEPDYEILIARNGEEVIEQLDYLRLLGPKRLREIGNAAFRRTLAHHTYAHRAAELDHYLGNAAPHTRRACLAPVMEETPAEVSSH